MPNALPSLSVRIVAVLGMHRSGTSALAGTLAELGADLGDAREDVRFQPKGNNESRAIVKIHNRILRRNDASWWRPPAGPVEIPRRLRRRLREVLATFEGPLIGVKDPRMLLVYDLWRDLPVTPIGVFRNPVDVTRSLQARANARGEPLELLDDERCHALWSHYNRLLLAEHERAPFPLLNFDEAESFVPRTIAALRAHGIEASEPPGYFEPHLTTNRTADWRDAVEEPVAALYDQLVERAERPL